MLSKATGERVWNGTTYVPTERPTAEEIARETFHRAALVDETDRDPADIVPRRTVASTGSFEVAHLDGEWPNS